MVSTHTVVRSTLGFGSCPSASPATAAIARCTSLVFAVCVSLRLAPAACESGSWRRYNAAMDTDGLSTDHPGSDDTVSGAESAKQDSTPLPSLVEYTDRLKLPSDFGERIPDRTAAVRQLEKLYAERAKEDGHQTLGLAMAFVIIAETVLAWEGLELHADPLGHFEQDPKTKSSLAFIQEGKKASLRTAFDRFVGVAHNRDMRRFDFSPSAPHATGEWERYSDLLRATFALTPAERRAYTDLLWSELLSLPEKKRRTIASTTKRVPFQRLLQDFPTKVKGEKAGAVWQGMVFGFYTADSPDLLLRTGKVGRGSRRTGDIGDIDGYTGYSLDLSVEAKDKFISDMDGLASFLDALVEWPDTTAVVAAKGFAENVLKELEEYSVTGFTKAEIEKTVRMWDTRKQETAVNAFEHYIYKVEGKSNIQKRYEEFSEGALAREEAQDDSEGI